MVERFAEHPSLPIGERDKALDRFRRGLDGRCVGGAAGLPVVSRMARAQAYPTRPITMIVPILATGSPPSRRF